MSIVSILFEMEVVPAKITGDGFIYKMAEAELYAFGFTVVFE